MKNLIQPIEVSVTQYLYNNHRYETREKAKLSAIYDIVPDEDIVEWLADPANLQKLVDLG